MEYKRHPRQHWCRESPTRNKQYCEIADLVLLCFCMPMSNGRNSLTSRLPLVFSIHSWSNAPTATTIKNTIKILKEIRELRTNREVCDDKLNFYIITYRRLGGTVNFCTSLKPTLNRNPFMHCSNHFTSPRWVQWFRQRKAKNLPTASSRHRRVRLRRWNRINT